MAEAGGILVRTWRHEPMRYIFVVLPVENLDGARLFGYGRTELATSAEEALRQAMAHDGLREAMHANRHVPGGWFCTRWQNRWTDPRWYLADGTPVVEKEGGR